MGRPPCTAEEQRRWRELASALRPVLQQRTVPPATRVHLVADAGAFQGWRAEPMPEPGAVATLADGDDATFDFGTHLVGHPHLTLAADAPGLDAPVRLRFLLGELPREVAAPREPFSSTMLPRSWLQEESVTLDTLPATVTLPRRHAFRFIRIQVEGLSPRHRMRITSVHATAIAATFGDPMPWTAPTPRWQALDATAVRTLRNCLQDVFEDGPKRDRRLWLGDLRLQALTNACTLRRFDLVRRCLLLFAGLAREDGLVEACVFHQPAPAPSGNLMADYALLFVPTLLDYARDSGDTATARELWPLARHQVDTITGALDATGRLPEGDPFGWVFIDWNPALDKAGPLLGLSLYCLHEGAGLARRVDDHSAAARFLDRAARLTTVAREQWRNTSGRFVDPRTGQRSLALTSWMVLGRAVTGSEARDLLTADLEDPSVLQPAGPYLWHHVIHACHRAGAPHLGQRLIEQYWGAMLDRGADTFWEVFDPADDLASPYGNAHLNSYCHAWSCTPSWFLRRPEAALR
jgi:hypothetical protein